LLVGLVKISGAEFLGAAPRLSALLGENQQEMDAVLANRVGEYLVHIV